MLCVPTSTSICGDAMTRDSPSSCATQPPTPIRSSGRPFFMRPSRTSDCLNFVVAFSRTAHVFRKTKSASAGVAAASKPRASSSPATFSESLTFI
jgi:hypothetical protein